MSKAEEQEQGKTEEQEEEECCQNYYKCKFCHTILEGDYGVDCYDCDGEMCMELIQLTETELEELLEKLNSYVSI